MEVKIASENQGAANVEMKDLYLRFDGIVWLAFASVFLWLSFTFAIDMLWGWSAVLMVLAAGIFGFALWTNKKNPWIFARVREE